MAAIEQSYSKADRTEYHQEKMRSKNARRANWYIQLTKYYNKFRIANPQHKNLRANARRVRQMENSNA